MYMKLMRVVVDIIEPGSGLRMRANTWSRCCDVATSNSVGDQQYPQFGARLRGATITSDPKCSDQLCDKESRDAAVVTRKDESISS